MRSGRKILILSAILVGVAGICLAQYRRGGRSWGNWGADSGIIETEERVAVNVDTVRTAREIAEHSTQTPNWTNTPGFEKDVFTFVRIIYRRGAYNSGSPWGWIT